MKNAGANDNVKRTLFKPKIFCIHEMVIDIDSLSHGLRSCLLDRFARNIDSGDHRPRFRPENRIASGCTSVFQEAFPFAVQRP